MPVGAGLVRSRWDAAESDVGWIPSHAGDRSVEGDDVAPIGEDLPAAAAGVLGD
jgi:hypothetical protein